MRLEGRSRACGHSSEKQEQRAYHAPAAGARECTVDYICPPDWCHAKRDVASASELPVADEPPCRSVTMSGIVLVRLFFVHATASSLEGGVR